MWSAVVDRMTRVNPQSIIIFFFIIVAGMSFSGCNSVTPVVKIGLVGPFEGKHRDIGYDVIYSERMAVREVNRRGGIGDYRLALVALDDFGDPDSAKEMAASLATDEAVMVVIGHWLPETSQSAALVYEEQGVPIILAGEVPFGPIDPTSLPPDFTAAYSKITPFDEAAGPYSAAGYDALYLAVSALDLVQQQYGIISRERVGEVLDGLVYDGITGPVYAP
jgi:branched-chain amino acid transport system substrate-binding protein